MGKERSVLRDGDRVYLCEENDGWAFMRNGPEERRIEIVSVDQHGLHLVGGSTVRSSSRHLEEAAMRLLAEIGNETKGS